MERDEIGEWYEQKRREAEQIADQIKAAKARGAGRDELARLESALERARYVGD